MPVGGRLRRYVEGLLLSILGFVVVFSFLSPLRGTSLSETRRMQTEYNKGIAAGRNLESASVVEAPPWPKVFCMINTIPKNHNTRVVAVQDTWANHCDQHVFTTTAPPPPTTKKKTRAERKDPKEKVPPFWVFDFSSPANKSIPNDSREWLWDRLRAAFKKVHQEKLGDFDWFFKADDDTFAIMENMKEFLAKLDPNHPYFVISRHWLLEKGRDPNQIYGSGGAGYILSREAVKRFISIMPNATECRTTSYKHEDTEIGECLRNANVTFVDAVDGSNRHSMLPIDIADLLTPFVNGPNLQWAQETSIIPLDKGDSCCSPGMITTHYVKPQEMYAYYFLTYKLKIAKNPATGH
ncbi:unnamed protein product, partial [Mesorhabditis belari]|uniref:N-acetylgalactosaminide beta-1,3-galactosyltransferase n=1 Tax=Mesorhabditis belari TaxID=2138241 RepID=A0AAF3FAG7_9BILA